MGGRQYWQTLTNWPGSPLTFHPYVIATVSTGEAIDQSRSPQPATARAYDDKMGEVEPKK